MLTEEEVMTGSMIYIMLQSIDPREPAGKSARKHISRAIKKELAIHANGFGNKKRYLSLVNNSYELIYKARDELQKEDLRTDPGTIISTLMNRWPETIGAFNLSVDKVDKLREAYSDSGLVFVSVKYANRMKKVITDFLGEEKNEQKAGDS